MSNFIAVSKEPRWMKPLGVIFLLFGMIALIPFKADYLQMWDIPLFTLAGIGALLLLRASQRIGWRLNLEDNVLTTASSIYTEAGKNAVLKNLPFHSTR